MAKASELTSFTNDVQGRYLCNACSEPEYGGGTGRLLFRHNRWRA
jgi:hypothetical protein